MQSHIRADPPHRLWSLDAPPPLTQSCGRYLEQSGWFFVRYHTDANGDCVNLAAASERIGIHFIISRLEVGVWN